MNEKTIQISRKEQTNEIESESESKSESEDGSATATAIATRTERGLSRRAVLTMTAGAGAGMAGVASGTVSGAVTAQDTQTVTVELTVEEIDIGETTEATVSIGAIPRGLSGLLGEVRVDEPEVATIVDASINEEFGLAQDPEFSDDGSACKLVAADINGVFSEGDTDIELFSLEFEGQGDGEIELVVEDLVEASDGTFYDVDIEGDHLVVGDGSESATGDEDDGDDGASQMPGFGAGGAIAGLVGGIAYLLGDRTRRE
ncbi:hypothetical protein OB955_08200 [Halobacteria archaeon AArc-m2/3/4]|uniref:PGF-CTERM protein n=1 Tax=Natronoglomus mannanivorans TaxID=2979990 RepID=A0ABT2QCR7_9EURY|nr:hypothetical protein [Halobacteria archaeon AArc-m2/3/4]